MNKKKYLNELRTQGLISQEQEQKILAFEESREKKNWALLAFVFLGASVIIVGIVSLIAGNWEKIAPDIKLVLNFILLISIVFSALWAEKKEKFIAFEGLLVALWGLSLATIGLISQVFHTGGHFYEATLFWSFLSFPILLVSKKPFLPFIWSWILTASVLFKIEDSDRIPEMYLGYFFPLAIGLVSLVLHSLKAVRFASPFRLIAAVAFVMGLGYLDTLFFAKPLREVGYMTSHLQSFSALHLGSVALTLLLAILVYAIRRSQKVQAFILSFAVVLYAAMFLSLGVTALPSFFGGVFNIAVLSLLCFYFAVERRQKIFNLFIFLVAARFIGIYLQAFGGLLATGFGLIISGLFILFIAYFVDKNRSRLQTYLEGFSK